MISLYPSNKLEHLSTLLNGLLNAQPSGVFEPDSILVENPGMQHWLNLDLAKRNCISMNLSYPLTTRFVWDIARIVLGDDAIPAQSPYRREVLRFRILALFNDTEFCSATCMKSVARYWSNENDEQQDIKKMTLAVETADAFEQYIMFRPQWLSAWEQNQDPIGSVISEWQSFLWRKLVDEQPWHPANLLEKTAHSLFESAKHDTGIEGIPSRIIVFAVNALAPSLLHFFDALGHHCDIHFFYLNPSMSFWGDVQSDKAQSLALRQDRFERSASDEQQNRLLANLGQHGRDLLNRLLQLDTFEISAFESPIEDNKTSSSVLGQLQHRIYEGIPNTELNLAQDNSITLVSCHTALRELQVLHDYLVKRMTKDPSLLGRDVIVLCPAIEDYAPYVYSVFAKPTKESSAQTDKITCSVSDRNMLDTNVHISAFLELLALPDSRFSVSSIMMLLDNADIASQFNLSADNLDSIRVWLEAAAIRWGLNAIHKAKLVGIDEASEQNSWEWGLQRILLGIVSDDESRLIDELLTVADVEGLDSVVFGELVSFLMYLKSVMAKLQKNRTIKDWVTLLSDGCKTLFPAHIHNELGVRTIQTALSDIAIQAQQAEFDNVITVAEMKELLSMAFSSPDLRNQFLTGHVTFCSMMPMRSVPFNTLAVLGLNDGHFPRKTNQQSVNIMSMLKAEPGDRSRSKEDRYLFLEAILSAREALYLSFQGANSRDNSERQPSTVLTLFQQELRTISDDSAKFIHYPLHHFSAQNYRAPLNAINKGGFRLAKALESKNLGVSDEPSNKLQGGFSADSFAQDIATEWTVNEIAQCLQNPIEYFAKYRLDVNLSHQHVLYEDDEPFGVNNLTQYLALTDAVEQGIDTSLTLVKHSGKMPDSVIATSVYDEWEMGIDMLIEVLPDDIEDIVWETVRLDCQHRVLTAQARMRGNEHIDYHLGKQTAKRKTIQWLRHLILSAGSPEPIVSKTYYIDWKDSPTVKCVSINELDQKSALDHLNTFVTALLMSLSQPTLYHAKMGLAVASAKSPSSPWNTHLQGNEQLDGIVNDPYFKWLCTDTPVLEDWLDDLMTLYKPMTANMKDKKVAL